MTAAGSIGPFEIIASLGSGPRGTVYRARHVSHGRIVAIKQLSAAIEPDTPEFSRLWNEVARLRAVVSSHVASTHSVEVIDGFPVIEMESLGESLARTTGSRPLGLREALGAIQDVLSGLKVMHDAGIVHGNLKPSNVLQDTTTGSWKISDGGTSPIESQSAPTMLATNLLYMPPESIGPQREITERSDLYSAGMIGLEAVLGSEGLRDAFPGVTNISSPSRWLAWLEEGTDALPLREVRPDTPELVSDFFSRLVSKDPEARYASAFAASIQLEAVLEQIAVPRTEPVPRPPAPTESAPPSLPGKVESSLPCLVITDPAGLEQRVTLADRTFRIGRDAQNDVVLPDDTKAISRTHAELRREGNEYVVYDLGSQNGLWVNGRRKSTVLLAPGVTVKIGNYCLCLSSDAGPAAANPAPVPVVAEPPRTAASVTKTAASASVWWPPKLNVQWLSALGAAVVVIAVAAWFLRGKDPKPESSEAFIVAGPAEPPPTVEQTPRERSLAQVRDLLARREFEAALKEVDLLLAADAADAAALALKKEAQDGMTPAAPPVAENPESARSTRSSGPRAGRPTSTQTTPATSTYKAQVTRRSGESEADWIARDKRLADVFRRAGSALEAGDLKAALAAFQDLESQEPGYPGAAVGLGSTRTRIREAVQSAMQDGAAKEKAGHLPEALKAFGRARDLDSASAEAQNAFVALQGRMRKEGAKAFKDAQSYENYGRLADARREYQKAFDLLPDDDPDRDRARRALERLGKWMG